MSDQPTGGGAIAPTAPHLDPPLLCSELLQARIQTTLIGGGQNFRGQPNDKHTQLTIVITGAATVLRVWYKTMFIIQYNIRLLSG